LSARKDLADLLIGVTGNFGPASEIVRVGFVGRGFGWQSRAPGPPEGTHLIHTANFRAVLGRVASGITIATPRHDAGRAHALPACRRPAGGYVPRRPDPALVHGCADETSPMSAPLRPQSYVGISFLQSSRKRSPRRFADVSTERSERFSGIAYTRGMADVVLL